VRALETPIASTRLGASQAEVSGVTSAKNERAGLLFAGLCALNGAFVPGVAKLATGTGDPLSVAALTTLFAAAAAFVVLAIRGELHLLLDRAAAPRLVAIGFLGTALAFFLYFEGVRRTSAIDAALCLQIEPVYSILVSWLVLGHRPTLRRVGSVAILLAGIVLAVRGGGFRDPVGVACLLATPIAWQASHLVVLKGLRGVAPPVLTGARYLYGGLLLSAYWLVSGGATALPRGEELWRLLPVLAIQGVILSYVGSLLWYQAIARIDLARATAIVVPSVPVLSLLVTFVLVGEVPTGAQWLGMAITAAGVLAFVTAPHAVSVRERIPTQTAPMAVPAEPVAGEDRA
jgi:drug/metabolite transporter (DMT)-like permease